MKNLNCDTIKIICYRSGLSEDGQYTITPILENSGIYSDPWKSLRYYKTTWNFFTHINLSEFLKQKVMLDELCSKLSLECNTLGEACTINSQIAAISDTLKTLKKEQQKIEDLIQGYQEPHKRRKRASAMINRALFGTLDLKDAEFYNNRIEVLENDDHSADKLIENQTYLIKSQFNEQRIKVSNRIDTLKSEIEINKKLTYFAETLELRIAENENETAILNNAILSAKRGKIDHEILSPSQLIQSAKTIQRYQQLSSEFPVPLENEFASELLKLSDFTIYQSRGKLIYIISVPLLQYKKCTLYRNIPLPIYQQLNVIGSVFAYIKPYSPFTAICNDKRSYFQLDNKDLNECKNTSDRFICKRVKSLREINYFSDCDIRLIVEPRFRDFAKCDIRVRTSALKRWSRIHRTNQWVFSSSTPETIDIKCESGESQETVINGTRILYLPPYCEARTSSGLLKASIGFDMISTEFGTWAPLNLSALYFAAIHSADSLNLSDLLKVDSSTPRDPNETEDANASNGDVKFRTIINRAKEMSKKKPVREWIHSYRFRTYGWGFGLFIIPGALSWKYSLCSRTRYRRSSNLYRRRNDNLTVTVVDLNEPPPYYEVAPHASPFCMTPTVNEV